MAHDLGIARGLLQRRKAQLAREPEVGPAFPGTTPSSRGRAATTDLTPQWVAEDCIYSIPAPPRVPPVLTGGSGVTGG